MRHDGDQTARGSITRLAGLFLGQVLATFQHDLCLHGFPTQTFLTSQIARKQTLVELRRDERRVKIYVLGRGRENAFPNLKIMFSKSNTGQRKGFRFGMLDVRPDIPPWRRRVEIETVKVIRFMWKL